VGPKEDGLYATSGGDLVLVESKLDAGSQFNGLNVAGEIGEV
jgi:hypothetical protein